MPRLAVAATGLALARLAVAGLPLPGLAVSGLAVCRLAVSGLAVGRLAERGGRLVGPGLPIPRLAVARLAVAGLGVAGLAVSGLAVAGLASGGLAGLAGRWVGAARRLGEPGRRWAARVCGTPPAEAEARQAVLRLVLRPILRRGAAPLISLGRDYPGALRRRAILPSLAVPGGRVLTGGPVRLVLGRDG